MTECSFLIPVNPFESREETQNFEALHYRLLDLFGGYTFHNVCGAWDDEDGETICEDSRRYIVAVPAQKIDLLVDLLLEFKPRFKQKKIYFSEGTRVRLI